MASAWPPTPALFCLTPNGHSPCRHPGLDPGSSSGWERHGYEIFAPRYGNYSKNQLLSGCALIAVLHINSPDLGPVFQRGDVEGVDWLHRTADGPSEWVIFSRVAAPQR